VANQEIEVLVVGAGQAGIAMSEHLSSHGVAHLVLERDRIAERWRSWRWDSLVANGPAWHDRFPGQEFNVDPDAFAGKEQVADYLVSYAEKVVREYQIAWIQAEDPFHEAKKQVFALAEKSVRIGWTFCDGFKITDTGPRAIRLFVHKR